MITAFDVNFRISSVQTRRVKIIGFRSSNPLEARQQDMHGRQHTKEGAWPDETRGRRRRGLGEGKRRGDRVRGSWEGELGGEAGREWGEGELGGEAGSGAALRDTMNRIISSAAHGKYAARIHCRQEDNIGRSR